MQPSLDGVEHARIGRDPDQQINPIHGEEFHRRGLVRQRDRLHHGVEFLGNIGRLAVLDVEQAHALIGELVGVELGDQFHGAFHTAAIVLNEQQVGRWIRRQHGVLTHELLQDLEHFLNRRVFEEQHVQHQLIVRRRVFTDELGLHRLMGHIVQGHNAPQVADLKHARVVDAENGLQ